MGNTSSAPKISAQDKAILDLKLQRDKLHQYQKRVSALSTTYTSAARTALSQKDRPKALLLLRQKKHQETLLSRTDAQLAQLEQLTADVEFALVQKDVVFGLQRGTEVLREIRREMGGIEGVERLVGRSEEEKAYQAEVGELLAGTMSLAEEEEVEEELGALERQTAGPLPDVPAAKEDLPSAPEGDLEAARRVRADEARTAVPA